MDGNHGKTHTSSAVFVVSLSLLHGRQGNAEGHSIQQIKRDFIAVTPSRLVKCLLVVCLGARVAYAVGERQRARACVCARQYFESCNYKENNI